MESLVRQGKDHFSGKNGNEKWKMEREIDFHDKTQNGIIPCSAYRIGEGCFRT